MQTLFGKKTLTIPKKKSNKLVKRFLKESPDFLMVLKIVSSAFPVVWRCVKSDPICLGEHRGRTDFKSKILNMINIYDQISCCVKGTPRTDEQALCGSVERNGSQLESKQPESGSTTIAAMEAKTNMKHKVRWTSEMEDQTVNLWQQHKCLHNVSCKTLRN